MPTLTKLIPVSHLDYFSDGRTFASQLSNPPRDLSPNKTVFFNPSTARSAHANRPRPSLASAPYLPPSGSTPIVPRTVPSASSMVSCSADRTAVLLSAQSVLPPATSAPQPPQCVALTPSHTCYLPPVGPPTSYGVQQPHLSVVGPHDVYRSPSPSTSLRSPFGSQPTSQDVGSITPNSLPLSSQLTQSSDHSSSPVLRSAPERRSIQQFSLPSFAPLNHVDGHDFLCGMDTPFVASFDLPFKTNQPGRFLIVGIRNRLSCCHLYSSCSISPPFFSQAVPFSLSPTNCTTPHCAVCEQQVLSIPINMYPTCTVACVTYNHLLAMCQVFDLFISLLRSMLFVSSLCLCCVSVLSVVFCLV